MVPIGSIHVTFWQQYGKWSILMISNPNGLSEFDIFENNYGLLDALPPATGDMLTYT